MGEISAIEWTDSTWNPWHGCIKVSPGCKNCYMYRDKKRYGQDPMAIVRSKKATFNAPLKWKDPRMVFTCSWSDFFIEEADDWRNDAWDIIRSTPQHTYQILTKRPERIAGNLPIDWPLKNVWLGVSAEDQQHYEKRAWQLTRANAVISFLSLEPLLGPIKFGEYSLLSDPCFVCTIENNLGQERGTQSHPINCRWAKLKEPEDTLRGGINWVIVGGESGAGFRQINPDWARSIRDQCKAAGVPFFMKQMSGIKSNMQPIPEDLQIQEMPG